MRKRSFLQVNDGFTLIELMIVVAIIGILAAIAIPQFERFMAKTRRTEGVMALSSVNKGELAFYAANDFYLVAPMTVATIMTNIGIDIVNHLRFYHITDGTILACSIYCGVAACTPPSAAGVQSYLALTTGEIDNDPTPDALITGIGFTSCTMGSLTFRSGSIAVLQDDIIL